MSLIGQLIDAFTSKFYPQLEEEVKPETLFAKEIRDYCSACSVQNCEEVCAPEAMTQIVEFFTANNGTTIARVGDGFSRSCYKLTRLRDSIFFRPNLILEA